MFARSWQSVSRTYNLATTENQNPSPPSPALLWTNNTCGGFKFQVQDTPDRIEPASCCCLLVSGGRDTWNIFYFPSEIFSDELVDRRARPVSYPGHLQCPQLGGQGAHTSHTRPQRWADLTWSLGLDTNTFTIGFFLHFPVLCPQISVVSHSFILR